MFHEVAYKARNRGDLLAGIDEFLDQVMNGNSIIQCKYDYVLSIIIVHEIIRKSHVYLYK